MKITIEIDSPADAARAREALADFLGGREPTVKDHVELNGDQADLNASTAFDRSIPQGVETHNDEGGSHLQTDGFDDSLHAQAPADPGVENHKEPEQEEDGATTDVNGRPWDERIHSSSRKTNQDGTWKYKRGVSDGEKAKVEAELDAALDHVEDAAAPPPPAAQPAPAAPTDTAAAPPPPAAQPATASTISWPIFMNRILQAQVKEGGEAKVKAALANHGIEHLALVNSHPELFEVILAEVE